ncbi:MAG TPA: 8-amino-7-oxononanoate synthase [Thermoanaerobaculia bacterium]|nr:8-amino-7-oxononanoate synthase [Thermoanaerobaculia bacterium]
MPLTLADELAGRLAELTGQGLARSLRCAAGLDFSSNDYLGLARDPALRVALVARLAALPPGEPLGAPASRLLRGHTRLHADLERRLAAWKGTEAALLFASGYQANVGLLSALLGPRDRAVSDALNHASLIDGLRLAGCRRVIVPHLDLAAIERELARPHPEGRTYLVTESLFSMEGDVAPLGRYAELAARHGAELIVDDAHATGLYGETRGSGLCEAFAVERRVAAVVSTLGKAVGLSGAFVAGPRVLVDYLVNRCRAFVFTTAPPPLLLHALDAALDCIAAEPWRRRRALELADRLRRRLRERGVLPMDGGEQPRGAEGFGEAELVAGAEVARVPGSSGASVGATATAAGGAGPIVPLLLGDNALALAAAERLAALGFDVRAIRPPTVPPGTARLRVSVHADHSEAEIDALAAALADALGTLPRGVGAEPVPLAVPSPSAPGAAQDRAAGAAAEPGTQIAGAGTVIAAAAGRTAGGEEP